MYTVISPQSYDEISTAVYGDARFGTELATANGGGSGTEQVSPGRVVRVPTLDTLMYNNQADSPLYNAQAIEGTFNPEIPQLIPHVHHHYLTQILDAIISLIAAIASSVVGGEGWILFAEELAISITANLATQAINLATGVEHHFDFKSLAISVITSSAGSADSAIDSTFKITELFEKVGVSEAMEMAQQGIQTALHLEHHLQWAGFVSAGLNAGVAKIKEAKVGKDVFTTIKGANAGVEATLSGLDSKHHRINPLAVATSMLGATLGQLAKDHKDSAKQTDTEHKATPPPSYTEQLTPGEHALYHSDNYKSQTTSALQQQAQAVKERQLTHMQAKQTVSANHTEAKQTAHADNDDAYVEAVRHLLFSGGVKLPGSELMLMGNHSQPSTSSEIIAGIDTGLKRTGNDVIAFAQMLSATAQEGMYDIGHPTQAKEDLVMLGNSATHFGESAYHDAYYMVTHPKAMWYDTKEGVEAFFREPLTDEVATVTHGLSSLLVSGIFSKVASLARAGEVAGTESSSLSRMEQLSQKYGPMTSQERMVRIDKLSMQNYERRGWELIREHGYANRYLSEDGLNASKRFGTVRGYGTTIDSDSSAEVTRRAQIDPKWGIPKYRTVIPADSINNIRIARPLGDTGSYGWEFFTNSYPEVGPGGWPQFIIDDVNLDNVQIMELKP